MCETPSVVQLMPGMPKFNDVFDINRPRAETSFHSRHSFRPYEHESEVDRLLGNMKPEVTLLSENQKRQLKLKKFEESLKQRPQATTMLRPPTIELLDICPERSQGRNLSNLIWNAASVPVRAMSSMGSNEQNSLENRNGKLSRKVSRQDSR